jgi:hypothetical protein
MAIPLGTIEFHVVEPEYDNLARALQQFLSYGSKKGHVTIEELVIVSDFNAIPERFEDVAEALKHGTKFFDACLYFTLPDNQRPTIRAMIDGEAPISREYAQIGEAIFVIYFYLITRARVPARVGADAAHPVPRFLSGVLSLTKPMAHYLDLVAGFDISKMDHKWIKEVNMTELGDEMRNRMGLGVAGYRMFGPFKSYVPKPGLPPNIMAAINVASTIARAPPDWNIHPITRNPNVLTNLGNLNQNLGNLMLEAFTADQLREMYDAKMIFQVPTKAPSHIQYKTWTLENLTPLNDPIFHT